MQVNEGRYEEHLHKSSNLVLTLCSYAGRLAFAIYFWIPDSVLLGYFALQSSQHKVDEALWER